MTIKRPMPTIGELVTSTVLIVNQLGGEATTRRIVDFYRNEVANTDTLFNITANNRPNSSAFRERISKSCARANDKGLLVRVGLGRYQITDSGRELLLGRSGISLPEPLQTPALPLGLSKKIASSMGKVFNLEKFDSATIGSELASIVNNITSPRPPTRLAKESNEDENPDPHAAVVSLLDEIGISAKPLNTHAGFAQLAQRVLVTLVSSYPADNHLIRHRNHPSQSWDPYQLIAGLVQAYLFEEPDLVDDHGSLTATKIKVINSLGLEPQQTDALDIHLTTFGSATRKQFKEFPKKTLGEIIAGVLSGPELKRWVQAYCDIVSSSMIVKAYAGGEEALHANIYNFEVLQEPDDKRDLNWLLLLAFCAITFDLFVDASSIVADALVNPETSAFKTMLELSNSFVQYLVEAFVLDLAPLKSQEDESSREGGPAD